MGANASRPGPSGPHLPTGHDTRLVRRMLARYLPLELADEIMEIAMYGPRVLAVEDEPTQLSASNGPNNDASQFCLVTPPLPRSSELGVTKVRMVKFKIRSRDQGWGGESNLRGPYDGAYSWFEAVILRPMALEQPGTDQHGETLDSFLLGHTNNESALPSEGDLRAFGFTYVESVLNDGDSRWMLQRNARADKTVRDHEITWTMDRASGDAGSGDGTGFVSALRRGDRVAVVARAQYGGWMNYVKSTQVEIYYN